MRKQHFTPSITLTITLALAVLGVSACGGGGSGGSNVGGGVSTPYTYTPPDTDAEWASDSASNVGIDSAMLETMMNRQNLQQQNIHSILIVKDERLVFETYFGGQDSQGNTVDFNKETPHEMWSVTKSIASLLIGAAMDDGYINAIDEPISTYLPNYQDLFIGTGKENLDLYDSLTMQSGISWNETGSGSLTTFIQADDPIAYFLSLPSYTAPGEDFRYNTGLASLMSEVINFTTDQNIRDYANLVLFEPLNIADVTWAEHPSGHIYSGLGTELRPRDMAKLGQLVLNGGQWQGEQVISQEWINESTLAHVDLGGTSATADAYGYYWWLRDFTLADNTTTTAVFAAGYGGQYIYILPEHELIVVFTAGNFGSNTTLPHTIMENDIVPGIL